MLADLAKQTGFSQSEVEKKAKECLKELYTVQQPVGNILSIQAAQYILSRGYDKTIDINPEEVRQLAKIARRHPVAYVMTHKTYIDMMVLGVVLVRHGLPLPYTFAGINMAFPGLAQVGRQNGVIFIRRSFKDDLIYKAVLRFFISSLVQSKGHFMWAIEGTRSRTGKLVWPKMGILKYIKEAEQDTRQEVKYVPVSIVYDLIPDVKDMTEEMRGKSKTPESLAWFMNYIRKMGDNFGKISLRFGEPVDMNETGEIPLMLKSSDMKEANEPISRFALELVHGINKVTPVTTASLICISLLSKFSLTKRAIESDIVNLMRLVESHKGDALVDRGQPIGVSVQSALALLRSANLIQQKGESLNAKYVINSSNYLQATYYANMSVHHLYHQAFIELALLKAGEVSLEKRAFTFWTEVMNLRDLFKFEFFYSKKSIFTEEIEQNLTFLKADWQDYFFKQDTDVKAFMENQSLVISPVVLYSYIDAYRVVAYALQSWDTAYVFDEKKFMDNCLFLGEEMHWQGRIQRLGSVSKPFLLNGIRFVKHLEIIPSAENPQRERIDQLLTKLNDVANRVKLLQGITLQRPKVELPAIPIERDIVPGSKTEAVTRPVLEGESGAHIGAFFDLDRTLIQGFSAKEFFQTRLLSGRMSRKEILAQFAGVLVYARGNGNFAGLAAVGAKGVKGVKEELFIEVGEEVYLKHLAHTIYPESRALVAAHLAKGHTVAIISAATPYQVDPIARDLGIPHVMCTRMEVEKGVFTGNMIEPVCWGEGKAYAAKELVKQFDLDLSKSYFYTDSAEDMPLLEIVGNPRPLNPDTKLAALAFENGWPVSRFYDEPGAGAMDMARTGLALGALFPAALNGMISGATSLSWREGTNSLMATVGDLVTNMAGIRLVVKNKENLWNHRPAVFIFNHQSSADLFIAAKLIRKNATGIAKKELKMMPIIGQMMTAAGVIFIDRKDKEKAIAAMKPAVEALKNGMSIIIFPEGTRSRDYRLGQFKKGAFHMAMEAGVPIVPIVIRNAHDAMPRGSNVFRPTAIEVIVKEAISVEDWSKENLNEKIGEVREMFLKELGQ
ncbi:MAG: putative phosphoserine phosphatase/1-acylglycerol-3-phosphate O-acyltransferase [Saprospiraceae bacterium]|jgi:putative phosphoserine phosphatase/1-acylglycerol-3-phosphate O-acyltransferase